MGSETKSQTPLGLVRASSSGGLREHEALNKVSA